MNNSLSIFNNSFVSVDELNTIIGYVRKGDKKNVLIIFEKYVDRIDILFVSGLLLCYKDYNVIFGVRFKSGYNKNRIFEVRQYLAQYQRVYYEDWKCIFYSFQGINELKSNDYVASKSFVPILYISRDVNDCYFNDQECLCVSLNDNVYKRLCELKDMYIEYILRDCEKNKAAYKYFHSDDSIISNLKNCSVIYTFVFVVLYAKIKPFKRKKGDEYAEIVRQVNEMWLFTKEFVRGVYELAKNIVEHSDYSDGMITIRAYDEDQDNDVSINGRVLESYVIDFGEKGIVMKLHENTKRNIGKNKVYEEDYDIIDNTYSLKDFIAPGVTKKLKQQLYRELAHYGMMRFYQIIKRNDGFVVSVSNGLDGRRDVYESINGLFDKYILYGTCYYFQIPFKNDLFRYKTYDAEMIAMQGSLQTVNSFSEIMKYLVVDAMSIEEKEKKYGEKSIFNFDFVESIKIRNRQDEHDLFVKFIFLIERDDVDYIAINFKNIDMSSSSLLRFFAHMANKYDLPLIAYNILCEKYQELIEDNENYLEELLGLRESVPYWYKDKSVLVYSYLKDSGYNFADLLFGHDHHEYKYVNYLVSHTFPNSATIINKIVGCDELPGVMDKVGSFFFKSSLLPFDILIKGLKYEAIFYHNLLFLLEKNILFNNQIHVDRYNKIMILNSYVDGLDGYKIKDTHFKIGTAIHSSDFYYAKRLFQNSYYTARIAILLAIKIKLKLLNRDAVVTLVGYEMYSELLVSYVKKFLIDYGYKNINHIVVVDEGDKMAHLPKNNINDNIIIIVPIASTGSTSEKIERYICSLKGATVSYPMYHMNVLRAIDEKAERNGVVKYKYDNQNDLIRLGTKWYSPSECKLCYENEISRALFGTDKSSLTPTLIFDVPMIVKESDDLMIDFEDLKYEKSLIYRNEKRNDEHFLFSLSIDDLINENEHSINKWLNKVKEVIDVDPIQKVVIVSPCHYSNTRFIGIVNDILFNSSATIIHHQIDADYLENFKLLNKVYLMMKDAVIFFVDDSLISGSNFFKIYDLYRYTTAYDVNKKMNGAIFLTNNSSANISERVTRAAGKLYAFVNINVPISPKVYKKKPLEHEVKRYYDLSDRVLHDSLKITFYKKGDDISGKGVHEIYKYEKIKRHAKMFKATHYIFKYVDENKGIHDISFNEFLEKCKMKSSDVQDRTAMLKVLSQYPFLLYMPIKNRVFQWHKEWMNNKIKFVIKDIDNGFVVYEDYREIKFLIRRSVFLENYYIVSEEFFGFIYSLMAVLSLKGSVRKIMGDLSDDDQNNIDSFYYYLLEQYVELIYKNPWSAIKIKKYVCYDLSSSQWEKFSKMMIIELSVVLMDFYALLSREPLWRMLYKDKSIIDNDKSVVVYDLGNTFIKNYLNSKKEFFSNTKYEICEKVLGLRENDEINERFYDYLWLKQFFQNDNNGKMPDVSISEKTNKIFEKIRGMCCSDGIGAFFMVMDAKGILDLVYDKDADGDRYLGEMDEKKHNVIIRIMRSSIKRDEDGYDNIYEYIRGDAGVWYSSCKKNKGVVSDQCYDFMGEHKWLLIIRITDKKYKSNGLIGLYSKKELFDDILNKQFLMSLRSDISAFIVRHHQNDEFSLLREAEATKRFAYLAGHGRQVIRRLANNGNSKYVSVVLIMEKLQYLFATKYVNTFGYASSGRDSLNEKIFKEMFPADIMSENDALYIRWMLTDIFKTTIIENFVEIDESIIHIQNAKVLDGFKFNKAILQYICFELIVNAKKNRYHFIEDCLYCGIKKNKICVKFELIDNALSVSVRGTGPAIPMNVIERINNGRDIKNENEIAGLNLINKVLKIMNNNNRVQAKAESLCSKCGIFMNIIQIIIESYE